MKRVRRTIAYTVLTFLLVLSFSLVPAMPVSAQTTWYVDDNNCPGPGDGSPGNPFCTIQAAVDAADNGDTINVLTGEYAGAVVDNSVNLVGAEDGSSHITSGVPYKVGGPAYTTAFRLDSGADGAEISNFTIDNNQGVSFYFAVFSRGIDNVTIDNLAINDTVQGITNWGGSGWTITNNVITDTVAAGGGGIGIFLGAVPPDYRACANNLVQYNIINASATADDYSCPGICACLDLRYGAYDLTDGTEDVSGNRILDNTITASGVNNGVGIEVGTILGNSEADPDRTDPVKIAAIMAAAAVHDNTIQGNTTDGAEKGIYFYNVTDLSVTQNIIENSVENGIFAEHGQSGSIILNNTFFNNDIQLTDDSGTLDIAGILAGNTFDRAVTVDHPGNSLLFVIWSSIQDAIAAAENGDTIMVAPGVYSEGKLVISRTIFINGDPADKPVIRPSANMIGDNAADAWFFVMPDVNLFLNNVVLDGSGFLVWQAIRSHGFTQITDVDFRSIQGSAGGSPYRGIGISSFGGTVAGGGGSDSHGTGGISSWLDVTGSTFEGMGRIGILVKGTQSPAVISDCTFTGKGDGDWLDYGCEAGAGGNMTVENCTLRNCTGVAYDGSTSAGILVTTYWGSGTQAKIFNNEILNNTTGIAVGYDGEDTSVVDAHCNNIVGNASAGIDTTAPPVKAIDNWWGHPSGPGGVGPGSGDAVSTNVFYDPWLSGPWQITGPCGTPPPPVTPEPPPPYDGDEAVGIIVGQVDKVGLVLPWAILAGLIILISGVWLYAGRRKKC